VDDRVVGCVVLPVVNGWPDGVDVSEVVGWLDCAALVAVVPTVVPVVVPVVLDPPLSVFVVPLACEAVELVVPG